MSIILTIIATIVADILFFKGMCKGQPVDAIIMFLIFACIFGWIFGHIEELIVPYTPPAEPREKHEKVVIPEVVTRCSGLLIVADALKQSDTPFQYSPELTFMTSRIRMYRHTDSIKAIEWCNKLESFLLVNKTVVAQVDEGYRWLRAIGEI